MGSRNKAEPGQGRVSSKICAPKGNFDLLSAVPLYPARPVDASCRPTSRTVKDKLPSASVAQNSQVHPRSPSIIGGLGFTGRSLLKKRKRGAKR
jgi:hypothetical protein